MPHGVCYLSDAQVSESLAIRDLSNPEHGHHAIALLVSAIHAELADWRPEIRRPAPVVPVSDNYDDLLYPHDAPARSPRYARYISDTVMLRTQMTSAVPPWVREIAAAGESRDQTLLLPGLVYRRDCVDRTHVGEPHQLDIWRLTDRTKLGVDDLRRLIQRVVDAVLPGLVWRANETEHPYTDHGLEVEAKVGDRWLEILECGLAGRGMLAANGLDPDRWNGLALGMGLDRLVMLRKRIDDIRLLRAEDPRIVAQMADLRAYRPVSVYPSTRRDISIAAPAGWTDEEVGDHLRGALGPDARLIEEAKITARHAREELPEVALSRLGVEPGQENLLIRVQIRSVDGVIDRDTALRVCRSAYVALHHGSAPGTMPA